MTRRIPESVKAARAGLIPSQETDAVDPVELHICQNCRKAWREDQLGEITHGFWERVAPGEPCPSGECPNCGALCHPAEEKKPPKLYLVEVIGDVEPVMRGPYKSEASRDRAAKRYRKDDYEGENGLYPLDVPNNGKPSVWAYSGAFFDNEEA